MSSDKYCCVPGCRESGGMHEVLHGFPNPESERERLRFNTWLYAIGGDILGLRNSHIYKYRRVCRSHFEEKYLCRNNRISNIAIPTLNLPGPLSWRKSPTMSSTRKTLQDQHMQNLVKPSTCTDLVTPEHRMPVVQNVGLDQGPLSKSPASARKPMQDVQNLPKPSLPRDHSPTQPMTSKPCLSAVNIVIEKENIDPETPEHRVDKPSFNLPAAQNVRANQRVVRKTTTKRTRRLYLNEREKELHMKIVATKIKLSKMKRQMNEIKAAKKLASNPAVLDTIEHFSTTAKLLMQIQWREIRKKEKGRRFTLQEKIAALSILKQSPRGYRFFRKIFILPAPQTLVKLIQQSNMRPGINKKDFSQLKKKCSSMTREEKLCVILFDEISLKPQLTYGERKDKITGFVDDGQQRKPEFADHAQVFMVRGLINNYKQAVSYTFSASATKGPELAKQIKTVVTELDQAGLTVVASVCDQGSNNRQALKILLNETRGIYLRRGEEPKENVILINENEIIPLYDPPHLLKGLRNNLLTKNLVFSKDGRNNTAKWSHLQLLLKENPGYKGVKLLPKLTENHVNPEKLNKMKVKYASQIFSRTVASNMGYLADKGILPKECKETADLLLFVDDIFDSVNGSNKKNKYAKPLLGPATPTSAHKKTWSEGKKIFKTMKFITSNGKEEFVPTVANWVWTLDGIEILLKSLEKKNNITSVWLRHLNQDPLENFFWCREEPRVPKCEPNM